MDLRCVLLPSLPAAEGVGVVGHQELKVLCPTAGELHSDGGLHGTNGEGPASGPTYTAAQTPSLGPYQQWWSGGPKQAEAKTPSNETSLESWMTAPTPGGVTRCIVLLRGHAPLCPLDATLPFDLADCNCLRDSPVCGPPTGLGLGSPS